MPIEELKQLIIHNLDVVDFLDLLNMDMSDLVELLHDDIVVHQDVLQYAVL